jgi:hypothetical protein
MEFKRVNKTYCRNVFTLKKQLKKKQNRRAAETSSP